MTYLTTKSVRKVFLKTFGLKKDFLVFKITIEFKKKGKKTIEQFQNKIMFSNQLFLIFSLFVWYLHHFRNKGFRIIVHLEEEDCGYSIAHLVAESSRICLNLVYSKY